MYNYDLTIELLAAAEEAGTLPALDFKHGAIPTMAKLATIDVEPQQEEESVEAYYQRVAAALEGIDMSSLNHVASDMRQILSGVDADLTEHTQSVDSYVRDYEKSLAYGKKTNAIITSHEAANVDVELDSLDMSALDSVVSKEFLLDSFYDLANIERSAKTQVNKRVIDVFVTNKLKALSPESNVITDEIRQFLTDVKPGVGSVEAFAAQVNNMDAFKLTTKRMLTEYGVNAMSTMTNCLEVVNKYAPAAKALGEYVNKHEVSTEQAQRIELVREYVSNVCEVAAFAVYTLQDGPFADTIQYPNGLLRADKAEDVKHLDLVRHASVMYAHGRLPSCGITATALADKMEYVNGKADEVAKNDKQRYDSTVKAVEFKAAFDSIHGFLKAETSLESAAVTAQANSLTHKFLSNEQPMDELMYGILVKEPLVKKFYGDMSTAYAEELKTTDSLDEGQIEAINKKISSKFIADSLIDVYVK